MTLDTPVAIPETMTWELRDRKGETRTYEQHELSIEEEVRLVKLAGQTIQRLSDAGFPWGEVAMVIGEDGSIDWTRASQLLIMAASEVPEVVVESTVILFGISPTLENGQRNKDYEDEKAFLRRAMNFTKWVTVLEMFTKQNDYQRLARPFSSAATRAMDSGLMIQVEQQARAKLASSQVSTFSSPQATEAPEASSDD